jgi:hypothetical protein
MNKAKLICWFRLVYYNYFEKENEPHEIFLIDFLLSYTCT